MSWPDVANGGFELAAAGFALLSVRRLWIDKQVRGVSPVAVGFFSAWGFWNLFYYPFLGQVVSFIAGVCLVAVNAAYLAMMFYYRRNRC